MSGPTVSLGYVILCVKDVAASLSFYEAAFGLPRRFFHDDGVNAYGELETGATRLAFASLDLAKSNLNHDIVAASLDKPPLGVEVALRDRRCSSAVRPCLESRCHGDVRTGRQAVGTNRGLRAR